METLYALIPMLVPLSLAAVFVASLPTGIEILRRGNAADPLRREIEGDEEEKENRGQAA